MSVKFKTRDFGRRIDLTKKTLKEETGAWLGKQASLLSKYLSRMTPPHGRHPIVGDTDRSQQLMGWHAVTRDVYRAMRPIEEMSIVTNPRNPSVAEYILRLIKGGRGQSKRAGKTATTLESFLLRLNIRNQVATRASAGIHNAARIRGKVRKGHKSTLIIHAASLKRYAAEVRKHVGKSKSGWAHAAAKLGRKLPKWITNHGQPGDILDRRFAAKPFIRIINLVPWRNDFRVHEIRAAAEKTLAITTAKTQAIIMRKMQRAFKA